MKRAGDDTKKHVKLKRWWNPSLANKKKETISAFSYLFVRQQPACHKYSFKNPLFWTNLRKLAFNSGTSFNSIESFYLELFNHCHFLIEKKNNPQRSCENEGPLSVNLDIANLFIIIQWAKGQFKLTFKVNNKKISFTFECASIAAKIINMSSFQPGPFGWPRNVDWKQQHRIKYE